MSTPRSKRTHVVKKSTKKDFEKHDIDKMNENTEHVLLYCAHLESMLKKLQNDYDRLQDRQEEIMSKLKNDQDAVVSSIQTLFSDLSNSVQDLINNNNIKHFKFSINAFSKKKFNLA